MSRFIDCGELIFANGYGFDLPYLLRRMQQGILKDGILSTGLSTNFETVKNRRWSPKVEIKEIKGDFTIYKMMLDSFINFPNKIGASFIIYSCKISSMEGFPKEIGDNLYIIKSVIPATDEELRKICNIKGEIIREI
jgi:hypothetical protein